MTEDELMKEIKPFDIEIKRLETIILFLGCALEDNEGMLQETKIARIKRIKALNHRKDKNE